MQAKHIGEETCRYCGLKIARPHHSRPYVHCLTGQVVCAKPIMGYARPSERRVAELEAKSQSRVRARANRLVKK